MTTDVSSRCRARGAAVIGLLVAVAVAFSGPARAAVPGSDGDLVTIGDGRRMYLHCAGEGAPTVVFESGYRNDAEPWVTGGVFDDVARSTRACVYDRPGTRSEPDHVGRSDPVVGDRTAAAIVDDLHAALAAANESAPLVLVAHSYGGVFARLYASTHPDDVVGLVLVDASSEHQEERLRAVTPEAYAHVLDDQDGDPSLEHLAFPESATQLDLAATATPLRPMPLVVLTHGIPMDRWGGFEPGFPVEAWEDVVQDEQRRFLDLVPGSRQIVAADSGHFIQIDQPTLVSDSTLDVVAAVRAGRTEVAAAQRSDTGGPWWPLVTIGGVAVAAGAGLVGLLARSRRAAHR